MIDRTGESRLPEALTMEAKSKAVVLDSTEYQELLDRLDYAEAVAGIQRGLMSMRRGEGVPAKEALDRLRSELGVGAYRCGGTEPGADT
jgi:hypothetical protein